MKSLSLYDRMDVTVPDGEIRGLRVSRFEVKKGSLEGWKNAIQGRGTPDGWYVRLEDLKTGTLWMSSVRAEKRDHVGAVLQMESPTCGRVLINGLGLGMVLAAALSFDHVKHVDVVESDDRVIELVGPHYTSDPRVKIHHADAFKQAKAWPKGSRWDVAWSDIWPEISADNYEGMKTLNRSYGRRSGWHGCWCEETVKYHVHLEKKDDRRYAAFFS